MLHGANFVLFLAAAIIVALTPGPGIFYVAARTLAGGRGDGLGSSLGTGMGGLAQVAAGALGVSALVMASAQAFALLKFLGALYLVYLGVKTWRSAEVSLLDVRASPVSWPRAFRAGVVVEALNPKTAAFFLAFIPQFIDPAAGSAALQFAALGLVSVALNTAADVAVVLTAVSFRRHLMRRPWLVSRLRRGAGCAICALGISLALARQPS